MTWEPRNGISLGTWYVCQRIPTFIHHTYFVLALDVLFYLHAMTVYVIFIQSCMLGLYLGWLKHFKITCRMRDDKTRTVLKILSIKLLSILMFI